METVVRKVVVAMRDGIRRTIFVLFSRNGRIEKWLNEVLGSATQFISL